jgi:asparagine synthase (glutamine-hydrolysing)
MCGINGIFDFGATRGGLDPSLVVGMNRAIAHRGPDDEGSWLSPDRNLLLGHRRLSILDLSAAGHQPMAGASGAVIVFNGEIYNFQELRRGLGGAPLRSDTDTEVLLRLYEERGQRCVDDLNGMFAFALWDPGQRRLMLARDRIGIKPLYFTLINGVFAFSSEIKALLTLPWVKPALDEEALSHFLTFNRVVPPRTMFRDIRKLDPGHMLVVGPSGIERDEPFWEVDYGESLPTTESGLAEHVEAALRRSVRLQMVSDVPIGAFLSGGVDSSAVVALMTETSSAPVRTFTIGFQDAPGYDEREHARRIAERYGAEHHERIVQRQEIVDFLPRIVDIYDEPLADATSIPIWFLSRLAHDTGTKVILTGDGADEIFCGYRNWLQYQRLDRLYRGLAALPAFARGALAGLAGRLDEDSALHEILGRAARRQEFFWGGAGGLKESTRRQVISPEFARRMEGFDLHRHVADYRRYFRKVAPPERQGEIVDWMAFVGLKDIVPNLYLYRADRLGMAHSIELRVPFLDHHFVRTALSIPPRWKVRNGEPKYILKRALEGLVPRDALYRRKQGFCVPLELWMQEAIVDHLEERTDAFCAATGLFDAAGIHQMVHQARAGKTSVVHGLWNLYFLMTWFDRWLLRPPQTQAMATAGP